MTKFQARYFDGKTSRATAVRVEGSELGLRIVGPDIDLQIPLSTVTLEPPIGNARRTLNLPGSGQLQTDDREAISALFPRSARLETGVHALEARWSYVLVLLGLTALVTAWLLTFGLPRVSGAIAAIVPDPLQAAIGKETLRALDKSFCKPSRLNPGERERTEGIFAAVSGGNARNARLQLRSCPSIGPNAFALPGGTIVVTDELVHWLPDERQLSAVLAHELGHVRQRHGLRLALETIGVGALVAALAGDAGTITSLAVVLPSLLLQSGYSRKFESEADADAFARLKRLGLSPADLADALERLEAYRGSQSRRPGDSERAKGERSGSVLDYFSTHPVTAERIARARSHP